MAASSSDEVTPLPVGAIRALPASWQATYGGTTPEGGVLAHMGTLGDGTCLFHSMCAALNVKGYNTASTARRAAIGAQFRAAFTHTLTEPRWRAFLAKQSHVPPEYESASVATVRSWFRDAARWADEIMIKYVNDYCGADVMFIDATTSKLYCGVRGAEPTQPVIMILWLDHSHFEPVLLIQKHCKKTRRVQCKMCFDPDDPADARIIRAFRAQMKTQCTPK